MSRFGWAIGLGLVGCASSAPQLRPPGKDALQAELRALAPGSRDHAWARLLLGETAAGQEALARLRAGGAHDARTLLGLALRAHDTGRTAEARGLWLELLERFDARDPFAPAIAELAASRLLGVVQEAAAERAEEQAYAERVARVFRKAELPEEARQLLGAVAGQLLRLHGKEDAARQIDLARGCPALLWGAGPYGHLPRLDLDRPFPPDAPQADPEPHRGLSGYGCSVTLSGGASPTGVVYALAYFRSTEAELPLTLETGHQPFALYIDGQRVYREEQPVRRRHLWLRLAPGAHALALKIAAPDGRAQVQIALPGARFAEQPLRDLQTRRGATLTARRRDLAPLPRPRRPSEAALVALLRGQQAYGAGVVDAGLDAVEEGLRLTDRFAPLWLLKAGLTSEDPSRPQRLLRDEVRALLTKVLALDPWLIRARVNLANLEMGDDKGEPALELLEALPAGQAPTYPWQLLRQRILKARGFLLEAEAALQQARRLAPAACTPLEILADARRELKDEPGAREAARLLARCNPYSERYAEELRHEGELLAAQREFERLLALSPDNEGLMQSLAEVLLGQPAEPTRRDRAERLLRELVARWPRVASQRVRLANLLVHKGQRDAARALLTEGVELTPEEAPLHKALLALTGQSVMDADRVDGLAIIREFASAGSAAHAGEAAELVLDRTVTRVFRGGARHTLTHNIIRVLTKDGAEKFGEVKVPEKAELLLLRTVKQDGTTREPEDIAGKDTVSAPDLEAGDYVEFEYVDRDEPNPAFPGGFLAERFFFMSADLPLYRTEYVLVTPWDYPKVQLDLRGQAPAAQTRRRGAERVTEWLSRSVPRLQPEPPQAEALLSEWAPSVRPGAGVSEEAWLRYLRDRLSESQRPSAALTRLARTVAGDPKDDVATRVGRLYDFVRRSIKGGGTLLDRASFTLARREGNRLGLLMALGAAADIPCALWLVRPLGAAVLDGPLPDVDAFNEALLVVQAGERVLYLDPQFRHGPAGLVRPALRGARAVHLWPAAPEADGGPARYADIRLASDGAPQVGDQRAVRMKVALAADGSGEVEVEETLRGWPALEWREELDRVSEQEVQKALEQRSLGFFFPGASLMSLRYERAEDDPAPLVLHYRFKAPRLARRRSGGGGAELVLPAPYPALLSRRYVGVPERRTPLQLRYVVPTELQEEVALPKGVGAVQVAESVNLAGFGRFAQAVERSGGTLRVRATLAMPMERVIPERYREFVRFAQGVDGAEGTLAVIPLPR